MASLQFHSFEQKRCNLFKLKTQFRSYSIRHAVKHLALYYSSALISRIIFITFFYYCWYNILVLQRVFIPFKQFSQEVVVLSKRLRVFVSFDL